MKSLFNSLAVAVGCLASGAASASICDNVANNIVQNCSFEQSDGSPSTAPGWTLSIPSGSLAQTTTSTAAGFQALGVNYGVDTSEPNSSGSADYFLSTNGQGLGTPVTIGKTTVNPSGDAQLALSQTLKLQPVANYSVSFFVLQDTPIQTESGLVTAGNFFSATFGGDTLVSMSDFAPTDGYQEFTFDLTDFAAANDLLTFIGQDDAGDLQIADVSVTVPEPGTIFVLAVGLLGLLVPPIRRSILPSASRAA